MGAIGSCVSGAVSKNNGGYVSLTGKAFILVAVNF